MGLYARTNHKPIQHQEFLKSSQIRQRYWARNYVGWDTFSKREPNAVHFAIKDLEVNYKKVVELHTFQQNIIQLRYPLLVVFNYRHCLPQKEIV